MKAELEAKLVTDYPELFEGVYKSPSENLMCFGCECGDGWYKLIDGACKELSELDEDIEFMQIKEKFGSLRLYIAMGTDKAWSITEKYETLSEHTCENCGQDGKVRVGGWIRCLCDECMEGKQS